MNPIIDDVLACGVTCAYPCEPAVGMDIVRTAPKYGKAYHQGGIDSLRLLTAAKPFAKSWSIRCAT